TPRRSESIFGIDKDLLNDHKCLLTVNGVKHYQRRSAAAIERERAVRVVEKGIAELTRVVFQLGINGRDRLPEDFRFSSRLGPITKALDLLKEGDGVIDVVRRAISSVRRRHEEGPPIPGGRFPGPASLPHEHPEADHSAPRRRGVERSSAAGGLVRPPGTPRALFHAAIRSPVAALSPAAHRFPIGCRSCLDPPICRRPPQADPPGGGCPSNHTTQTAPRPPGRRRRTS